MKGNKSEYEVSRTFWYIFENAPPPSDFYDRGGSSKARTRLWLYNCIRKAHLIEPMVYRPKSLHATKTKPSSDISFFFYLFRNHEDPIMRSKIRHHWTHVIYFVLIIWPFPKKIGSSLDIFSCLFME